MQAHSSHGTGPQRELGADPVPGGDAGLFERLRQDPALQDAAYDPPFCDFNLVIDNHGTAVNVTVPEGHRAHQVPLQPQRRHGADRRGGAGSGGAPGIGLEITREGTPPELPPDHPLVAARRQTSPAGAAHRALRHGCLRAAELAPCVILGPGTIETAHSPHECVAMADLAAAVPLFARILTAGSI